MNAKERLLDNGYEGVKVLTDFDYDAALIGVTEDNRAIYDYELMVQCLMKEEKKTYAEAAERVTFNTLRSLPYFGEGAPIILNRLMDVTVTVLDE